jgi:hypothetical protein
MLLATQAGLEAFAQDLYEPQALSGRASGGASGNRGVSKSDAPAAPGGIRFGDLAQ